MTLLAFILAIFILVGVHEYGHYIVAKWCGVRVLKFSIGFGKPIWKSKPKSKGETEWVVGSIPLGGYVKMLDGRDPDQQVPLEDQPLAFDKQVLWKRSAIVAAGPIANFLLAFLLLTGLFFSGVPQVKPIVDPGSASIASKLGVQTGDEVVGWVSVSSEAREVNVHALEFQPMQSWNRLRWKIIKSMVLSEGFALQLRNSQGGYYSVLVTDQQINSLSYGADFFKQLGFLPQQEGVVTTFKLNASLPEAIYLGGERVWDISVISVAGIGDLLTGKASLNQLSGPIAIADMAGKSAKVGFSAYIGFLALISISLGILNLLPFPLLDGGQLMYDLWEFVSGKRLSVQIQGLLQRIGIAGLFVLTVFTFLNDLMRLWLR